MGKVYSAPDEIKLPVINFGKTTSKEWLENDAKYLSELSAWCKRRNPNDPDYVGEVLRFPVADGYALYMVAALKPIQLIHIELGDAYVFKYAELLKKADIKDKIDKSKEINTLFGKWK